MIKTRIPSLLRLKFAQAATLIGLSLAPMLPAQAQTTVTLSQTPEAFKNPLKGFRPSRYIGATSWPVWSGNEYVATFKQYIPYTDLEMYSTDTAQKIVDWSNTTWGSLPGQNEKVIPRVVIAYPGVGEYWADGIPHDGTAAEWNTSTLQSRLATFIAKLGQAWDNDPRVAVVELGLWGKWGEQNIYPDTIPNNTVNVASPDRIPDWFQTAMGNAAVNAFHNKKVVIRYPETFPSFTFGQYWDSFALPDDAANGNGEIARAIWPTAYETGEVAYDWGNQTNLGGSPNGTLQSTSNTNYVIGWIQQCHTSSLGWIAEYDNTLAGVEPNATAMQKQFGYRFVINQATFPTQVSAGGVMKVSFNVSNVASAPFYYPWPVQAVLLDATKSVVWSNTFNTDIRTWMPGSSYAVSTSFQIPASLGTGTYTLAFAILDPAGYVPAVRFANTNYYAGGYTPIGKVGVGQAASDQNLGSFDGLKADSSLHYVMPSDSAVPSTPASVTATAGDGQVVLAWSAPAGATSYRVLRSTTSGSGYAQIAWTATAAATSYVDTNVSNGTTYYYVVQAANSLGASGNSAQASALPIASGGGGGTPQTFLANASGNTLAGGAKVQTDGSYSVIGYIGNGGTLAFNLSNMTAGTYTFAISYVDGDSGRGLQVSVDGGAATSYSLPGSGSWTTLATYTANQVTLGAGSNTILFSNPIGYAPDIYSITLTPTSGGGGTPQTFSANSSSNTLAGGATVQTDGSYSVVGYIGNGGTLTFNLSNMTAGNYGLTISYVDGDSGRGVQVSVNGGSGTSYSLPGTGSWTTLGSFTANAVTLTAGANTILLSNPGGYAPDIYQITLTPQ